jgi:hypothetical protein
MNTKKITIAMMGISSLATLTLIAAPLVIVQVPAPAPPAVTVVTAVPDTYVWDGIEFVGVVGPDYYYLGPGKVWLPFDSVRLTRFHDWERIHGDWRTHAIRNELYRRDAHGHEVQLHDNRVQQDLRHDAHDIRHDAHDDARTINQDVHDNGHDKDISHDKDHDHDH